MAAGRLCVVFACIAAIGSTGAEDLLLLCGCSACCGRSRLAAFVGLHHRAGSGVLGLHCAEARTEVRKVVWPTGTDHAADHADRGRHGGDLVAM